MIRINPQLVSMILPNNRPDFNISDLIGKDIVYILKTPTGAGDYAHTPGTGHIIDIIRSGVTPNPEQQKICYGNGLKPIKTKSHRLIVQRTNSKNNNSVIVFPYIQSTNFSMGILDSKYFDSINCDTTKIMLEAGETHE